MSGAALLLHPYAFVDCTGKFLLITWVEYDFNGLSIRMGTLQEYLISLTSFSLITIGVEGYCCSWSHPGTHAHIYSQTHTHSHTITKLSVTRAQTKHTHTHTHSRTNTHNHTDKPHTLTHTHPHTHTITNTNTDTQSHTH